MTNELTLSFNHLTQALVELHALSDAVETHGVLCGYVCAGASFKELAWQEAILGEGVDITQEENSAAAQTLIQTYQTLHTLFQTFEIDFQLLLPDDQEALPLRVRALSEWCQGFLTGLVLAGAPLNDSEEVREIILNLSQIAQVSDKNLNLDDTEEEAYANLCEHVRLSALFLHALLNRLNTTTQIH